MKEKIASLCLRYRAYFVERSINGVFSIKNARSLLKFRIFPASRMQKFLFRASLGEYFNYKNAFIVIFKNIHIFRAFE